MCLLGKYQCTKISFLFKWMYFLPGQTINIMCGWVRAQFSRRLQNDIDEAIFGIDMLQFSKIWSC